MTTDANDWIRKDVRQHEVDDIWVPGRSLKARRISPSATLVNGYSPARPCWDSGKRLPHIERGFGHQLLLKTWIFLRRSEMCRFLGNYDMMWVSLNVRVEHASDGKGLKEHWTAIVPVPSANGNDLDILSLDSSVTITVSTDAITTSRSHHWIVTMPLPA